jgi:MAP/microtubule affinity-regulating kinase
VDLSETVQVDETIIKIIETKYKIDRENILSVLRDKVYNDISAIYYLMYYDKDSRRKESFSGGSNDIIQVSTPTKKDSLSKDSPQPSGNGMPKIDEDGVLIADGIENVKSDPTQQIEPTPPLRKRAATTVKDHVFIDTSEATQSAHEEHTNVKPHVSATAASPPEHDPPAITRKRHNTIVGILKGKKAEDASGDTATEEEGDKPRSLRFTFNSSTTSSKHPDEIVVEVIRSCNKLGFSHRLLTRYLLECFWNPGKEPLKVEIEICKLPRLNNLHGLRFKRLHGSSADYKEFCEKLLETLEL